VPVKVTGAEQLDQALARVEEDASDKNTLLAMAQLVLATARPAARSSRVRATGRATATEGRAKATFGSKAVPWTAASHFSHGTASAPRAQGGWIRGTWFLFDAVEKRRDDVVDLGLNRAAAVLRANGFDVS
jgi:hypothetical protein